MNMDKADEIVVETAVAVPLTEAVAIRGSVHPGVAEVLELTNRAVRVLAAIQRDSVQEVDRYSVTIELPGYFKAIQDKLAGIVLRAGSST